MAGRFFRVATEGATTDGREIQRAWIEQMAKNYKPATYSARVWLEHIRGVTPDSAFAALGDVLALEARTVEDGKLALFAQIEALPALVAINKAKQKLYSSIEVDPNFAKTGEAYMTGLGVTDSPASLGTEVLKFAAGNPAASPFAGKKHSAGALFTAAVETDLGLEGEAEGAAVGLIAKFTEMLGDLRSAINPPPKVTAAPEKPEAFGAKALEVLGAADAAIQQHARELAAEKAAREKLQGEFNALKETLSRQDGSASHRPSATGSEASMKADC